MKYRYRWDHTEISKDLLLSEKDGNGLAVYSRTIEGVIYYFLHRPEDMVIVDEVDGGSDD